MTLEGTSTRQNENCWCACAALFRARSVVVVRDAAAGPWGLLPFAGAWQLLSLWYVIEYVKGMRSTSYSEFRRNLAADLDSVTDDHAPLIITRDRGKPAAVLMSLEDYASLEETRYLLSSPANAERLMASIAELEEGKGTEHELLE
jgi:antitoxin YefM